MSDQLPHDEELRSLYRRLPADEPRAEIDEAILSAAREAAASASSEAHQAHRRRFLSRARWILPLAAAASVILTVTLTRLTPEQPAIAPSELRESSDSAVAYGTAAPEAREQGEAELAVEALEDSAPAKGTKAGRQRAESADSTAQAPVEARESEAHKSAEEKYAGNERLVPSLSKKKLDESKRTEQPAPSAERSARAAAPAPPPPEVLAPAALLPAAKPSDGASAAASAEPLDKATLDRLESLGYAGGGDAPAAPAQPAPSADAAPASPPVASMSSRDDAEGDQAGENRGATKKDEALADRLQARAMPRIDWPFGLAPGLDAAQACHNLGRFVNAPCRYVDGVAVVEPKTAVVIDRGEFKDRKVASVTLFATSGRLEKIALRVEGFTTEQILVAPPAP